ncbi:MAG TPA: carboxypeptidase-like regulatory domain-containing protein [Mucilaginibacter sp.]|nr:carboxypeptidase-like regulatory domain-containing protein [Mucilaginibacter sp.]
MIKHLLLILWLLPITAMGQYHISGRVTDSTDKKPMAYVSVFLSNAIAGTKTNDDGTYTITNVRGGQYELVVSVVGYATYRQTIMVNNNLALPDIAITPKAIALNEVKIRPDPNWAQHYDMFRREFLGNSENATHCKILNPKVLNFSYDDMTSELTASSSDFVEIENKALGYKVKYLLSNFTKVYNTGFLYFEGSAAFEELQGKKSAIKTWQKNRLTAYLGSSMHFLRAVIAAKVEANGFKVKRLIRKPNPDYKGGPSNKYIETLVTTPLAPGEYAMLTHIKDQYALAFKDCLYIMYDKKPDNGGDTELYPQYLTSTITFEEPYTYFDNNGIIINPQSAIFEGSWGHSRMAELLPVDYEPLP